MNLEELMVSTPPMQQHALIKGFQAGAASRDEDVAAWSACEAAAKIPAVLEYVGQLEKERDQLRAHINDLREAMGLLEKYVAYNGDTWVQKEARNALSITPEQPLAEYRNKVIEDCAVKADALANCEENTDGYRNGAAWCAEAIRAMKEKP